MKKNAVSFHGKTSYYLRELYYAFLLAVSKGTICKYSMKYVNKVYAKLISLFSIKL